MRIITIVIIIITIIIIIIIINTKDAIRAVQLNFLKFFLSFVKK